MQTGSLPFAAVMLVFGTSALAGTKTQMNIVPTPADCFVGPGFCQNVSAGCGVDNSECALATMSPKSKVKIDGKLKVKASIKGVTDVAGALMTTGPAETAIDNLVLRLTLSQCGVRPRVTAVLCDEPTNRLPEGRAHRGQGEAQPRPRDGVRGAGGIPLRRAERRADSAKRVGLLDCPGTNSPADVSGRLDNDPTCDVGIARGIGGLLRE